MLFFDIMTLIIEKKTNDEKLWNILKIFKYFLASQVE